MVYLHKKLIVVNGSSGIFPGSRSETRAPLQVQHQGNEGVGKNHELPERYCTTVNEDVRSALP